MDTLLNNMFVLGVPVLEKMLRPAIVYAFLVIGLRLAGKRELAQLNPFDLVVLLTLSNTVQNAIIGADNSVTGGILGAATLLVINYFVVRLLYGHQEVGKIVEGDEDVLIEDGQVKVDHLKGELITLAELEMAAHKQGFKSLSEIERAMLEPGGTISFIGKEPRAEAIRYQDIITRLDQITQELVALRAAQTKAAQEN
jgi:uncharacterized membrane protein YcaP (DUF421 family)